MQMLKSLLLAIMFFGTASNDAVGQNEGDSAANSVSDQPKEGQIGCRDKKLCIGVRSQARPFSYLPSARHEVPSDAARGPLRDQGYTGYIIRICDAVLAEMLLNPGFAGEMKREDIGVHDIDKNVTPRFDGGLGKHFDILCDPATITNERRDNYMISPPLFLTGVSYITREKSIAPARACSGTNEKSLIGVVGRTTAPTRGIKSLIDAGELPRFRKELISYLRNRSACSEQQNDDNASDEDRAQKKGSVTIVGPVRIYQTHVKAAEAFCEPNDKHAFHYYVGDLEIITEHVRAIPGCDYDDGTQTYTNDRYAVFGKAIEKADAGEDKEKIDSETRDRVLRMARFFQILSEKAVFNPSILDKAFSDTFPDAKPSRKFELFLWSVRGERE